MKAFIPSALVGLLMTVIACEAGQRWEAIAWSKDTCHHCRMVISDRRFGAEWVTAKGKVHKFDSIECLAHFKAAHRQLAGTAFVVDSRQPDRMLEARTARFRHDPGLRSPMGLGLLATSDEKSLPAADGGKPLSWRDVLKLIQREDLIDAL